MNSTARTSGAFSLLSETQSGIGEFTMRFTSTPRGARLARRLASHRLDEWRFSYDSEIDESVTAIAGELAANAVQHGHVPGRDFALRLTVSVMAGTLRFRVEVSDTRGERPPSVDPATSAGGAGAADLRGVLAGNGRGLLIVGCLEARWGVVPRPGGPGKTVWAEYAAATPRPER
ncbi:ATP-binding protein [Streptomyces sp. NPDC048595]|uniref:ATP-binding protein n=1 Tax=Streptomyces sp. NPDC048595 TaxID=3365576 RepID=UPI00371849A4